MEQRGGEGHEERERREEEGIGENEGGKKRGERVVDGAPESSEGGRGGGVRARQKDSDETENEGERRSE